MNHFMNKSRIELCDPNSVAIHGKYNLENNYTISSNILKYFLEDPYYSSKYYYIANVKCNMGKDYIYETFDIRMKENEESSGYIELCKVTKIRISSYLEVILSPRDLYNQLLAANTIKTAWKVNYYYKKQIILRKALQDLTGEFFKNIDVLSSIKNPTASKFLEY